MSLSFKAARNFVTTCAAATTLGVALAPSNALAVTTWNWSFATGTGGPYGSGTFTTADVVPTAFTTYEITGISGTYNRGGTAYTITQLDNFYANDFQWNGTSSSPILAEYNDFIAFRISTGWTAGLAQTATGGVGPVNFAFYDDYATERVPISSSSLAPYTPSSTAVPGPLPLLGAAAAFQASRRLRRRLNGSLPAA